MTTVRVVLPGHLKRLAQVDHEVTVDVASEPVCVAAVLDAVEAAYPVLRGTIRDQATGKRRSFIRYFACEEDLSHDPADAPLPPEVATGREPLLVVGAMAGG
jgi:sulfur-carrier protein